MPNTIQLLKSEISALQAQVADLKIQERKLALVIESTGLGIWEWYVQTGETILNQRWANIIGYTLEELAPLSIDTWTKHAHPDDLERSNRLLAAHWAGKTAYYAFEARIKHKKGHWVWIYDTGQVIEWQSDGLPKRMIGTHQDITDKKQAQIALYAANKQLKEWSYLDSLTKIANRRAYDEKLASEISTAQRSETSLSLLMIDIDYFKEYNDHYGHQKGDDALSTVAALIRDTLPRKTDFIARYGGEEFVVILPFTNAEGAVSIAEKILNCIVGANIEHKRSKFNNILTISIGIATASTKFDKLLPCADLALFQAKKNGRNGYHMFTKLSDK